MACLLPWHGQVVRAWAALLAAAPAVGELETFRYDLVDVARQALSKRATAMWRVRCPLHAASPKRPCFINLGKRQLKDRDASVWLACDMHSEGAIIAECFLLQQTACVFPCRCPHLGLYV